MKKYMRKMFAWLGGIGFAALLDVVVTVFIVHFLAQEFGERLLWYHYLIAAPLIGVLPDFDVFLQKLIEGKIDDAHHFIMSHPLPLFLSPFGFIAGTLYSLPLGIATGLFLVLLPFAHAPLPFVGAWFFLGRLLFDPFWGWVFCLAFLSHYIHDSSMLDFGLRWLWPFSKNQYHFGGRSGLGKKTGIGFTLVRTYTPEDVSKLKPQFMNVKTWLETVYYQPTVYSLLELFLAATLISATVSAYFQSLFAGLFVFLATLLYGALVWVVALPYKKQVLRD